MKRVLWLVLVVAALSVSVAMWALVVIHDVSTDAIDGGTLAGLSLAIFSTVLLVLNASMLIRRDHR